MSKHLINPDRCTACTSCIAQCPVTAATRKFRGPKMVVNTKAQQLFRKSGYNFVGEMSFLGKEQPFFCYEKIIVSN
ncbi:4Fe-4S dicluster domain-containing protein [bacterium BFN5]|nr:4Fe-4S dicluster domain-containing protein [bacterium BFN5]